MNEPCIGASIEHTAALCILWAGWLEELEQHGKPELQTYALNLHNEESAVQAGLTLAWSNGPGEGFIHRLQLLKRQAYGRAGVALLKQRMLFHPSGLLTADSHDQPPDQREGARPQVAVTEVSSFCSSCTPMASAGPAAIPGETEATQPSSWASPMSSPSGPRM